MPVAQAEELKCQYGHAVVTAVPQMAEIEIANPQPQMLRLRTLAEILEPRARELLLFCEGKPAPGRRGGCPGRRLRADRRRSHAARNAGRDREPVAGSGAHRSSRAPVEYARRAGSSRLFNRHRHAFVRPPHQGNRAAESSTLRSKLRAIFAASF
jgi:cell division protein FtsA